MQWYVWKPTNGIWMIDLETNREKLILSTHFCIIQQTYYFRKCFSLFISINLLKPSSNFTYNQV
jgi:hypothetical protein